MLVYLNYNTDKELVGKHLQFKKPIRFSLTRPETFYNLIEVDVPEEKIIKDGGDGYLEGAHFIVSSIVEPNIYRASLYSTPENPLPTIQDRTTPKILHDKLKDIHYSIEDLTPQIYEDEPINEKEGKFIGFTVSPTKISWGDSDFVPSLMEPPIPKRQIHINEDKKGKRISIGMDKFIKNLLPNVNDSTHLLLNTDINAKNKGFYQKEGKWISIKKLENKKEASDKERVKTLLQPHTYEGSLLSRWDHYRNFLIQKFREGVDPDFYRNRIIRSSTGINPLYAKVSSSVGLNSPPLPKRIHFSTAPDLKSVQVTYYGRKGLARNHSFFNDPYLYEVLENKNNTPDESMFKNNTEENYKLFDDKVAPFLRNIGLDEQLIENLKKYDDKRVAYNLMLLDLAQKYKHDKAKLWQILSSKTNKPVDALKTKYILPGIVPSLRSDTHK